VISPLICNITAAMIVTMLANITSIRRVKYN
jgi:hypothetical protein